MGDGPTGPNLEKVKKRKNQKSSRNKNLTSRPKPDHMRLPTTCGSLKKKGGNSEKAGKPKIIKK